MLLWQAAWAVLAHFSSVFDSYKEGVQHLMAQGLIGPKAAEAAAAAAGARKPAAAPKGGPPPVDPESTLPGPSKQALDAAFKVLATITSPPAPGSSMEWLCGENSSGDLSPLVQLMEHVSPRIQMRAAQLAGLLATHAGARRPLLLAGAPQALVHLMASSVYGGVRIEAVQALQRLASTPGPQHAQLVQAGAVRTLMAMMMHPDLGPKPTPPPLRPQTPPVVPASPTAAAAAAAAASRTPPGPLPLDFNRPQRTTPDDLQLAAARLLLSMAFFNQAAVEEMAELGGVSLLMGLVPGPASSSPTPDAAAPVASQGPGQLAHGNTGDEKGGVGSASVWGQVLHQQPALQLPSAMLPSAQAQAVALNLVAHMLSIPGLQDALYEAACPGPAPTDGAAPWAGLMTPESSVGLLGGPAAAPSPAPSAGGVAPPPAVAPALPSFTACPIHTRLLHLFAHKPPEPPPPPPEANTKGKKDDKPKAPSTKGKGEVGRARAWRGMGCLMFYGF